MAINLASTNMLSAVGLSKMFTDKLTGIRGKTSRQRGSEDDYDITDMSQLSTLPLALVHFDGARHLHPRRLDLNGNPLDKTVSIRIMDTNRDTILCVRYVAKTLKRLYANGINITVIEKALIENLYWLEIMDFSFNCLREQSIPDELGGLERLVELNLNNNKISQFPMCLKSLRFLTRLDLSHNKLEALKGLETLKRLQILHLEHNLLTNVVNEVSQLKKLEFLNLSNNNIRELQSDIRYLRSLKELNLSKNKLIRVPSDVFTLPCLQSLNLSRNRITKIPNFSARQNRELIDMIDVSENLITKLPDHVLHVTQTLDLSRNKIKHLSGNVIKRMNWKNGHKLELSGNPLAYPPADVCASGLKALVQFFNEAKSDTKIYQGLRVNVVGSSRSGKTSLVQSLVDQQARLEDDDQYLGGVDRYEVILDSSSESSTLDIPLQLTLWDFCGDSFYMYSHSFSFELPSVTLLTFKLSDYTPERFHDMIGAWLDWMLAKFNKLVVILVGTVHDKVKKTRLSDILVDVQNQVSTFLGERKLRLENEISRIEKLSYISSTLSEELKCYMNLLNAQIHIHHDVVVTSSSAFTGFPALRKAIETFAIDKSLFPNVMKPVPTIWLDVESFLEEKGNSMLVPVVTWEAYEKLVIDRFGMKQHLVSITKYLHETGKIWWLSNVPTLKTVVFLRANWILNILKHILRHNIDECVSYSREDHFINIGMSEGDFNLRKHDLLHDGVLETDFLKGILGGMLPVDFNQPVQQVLRVLMDNFQICYPIFPNIAENMAPTYLNRQHSPKGDVSSFPVISRVLIPWFQTGSPPSHLSPILGGLGKSTKLVAAYTFPTYFPPGLIEIVSVRAHDQKFNLRYKSHWKTGYHAVHQYKDLHVLVTCCSHMRDGSTLRYDVRYGSEAASTKSTVDLWSVLYPLLMDVEEILSQYSGLILRRHMACSDCGRFTFTGEWMSPKELQSVKTRQCPGCEATVNTEYLVQPREKRRDDILKKLDELRRSGRLNGEATSNGIIIKEEPTEQEENTALTS